MKFSRKLSFPKTKSCLPEGFLLCLVFVVLIYVLLPVRYGANDDIVFVKRLSGADGFSAEFSSTANNLSQVLSYALYSLYALYPSIPWYGLTIYLATYLGISLIVSVLLRNTGKDRFTLVWVLPSFFLYFSFCSTLLTFTSAALLLEFGVFLSFFDLLLNDESSMKHSRLYGLLLILCFFFSYLIRWKIVLFCSSFGIPILFFVKKHQIQKIFAVITIFFVLIVGDRMLFYLNNTVGLKEYNYYHKLRSNFTDTIKGEYHGDITERALKNVGWTLDDINFFKTWILYDERFFNSKSLKLFLEENNPYRISKTIKLISKDSLNYFKKALNYNIVFIASLLTLFIYKSEAFKKLNTREKLNIAITFGIIGAGILFLVFYRFRLRVNVPLYIYIIGLLIVVSNFNKAFHHKKIIIIITSFLLFFNSGLAFKEVKKHLVFLEISKIQRDYVQYCLRFVEKLQPSALLVQMFPTVKGGLGVDKLDPLKELADFTNLRIFPSGTAINSPRYFTILKEMGIEGGYEFLKWTINNDDVLFVLFDQNTKFFEKKKYLWESYFNRRISPEYPVKLYAVYDFRNRKRIGLVFYNIKTLNQ